MEKAALTPVIPEIAFYYPNPFWQNGDWVKNLLLFFDGVALLVPEFMAEQVERSDPAIVVGLREHGLLHVLKPEEMVDKRSTEELAMKLADLITSGAIDKLAGDDRSSFAELSMSRLGFSGDEGLGKMLHEELMQRGLAKTSVDGVSIPMRPMVRSLVLVLLSQILRQKGVAMGMDLVPATDMTELVKALHELLSLPQAPSAGNVVKFDLEAVGVDVGSYPIDEVLSYRKENLAEYKRYAGSVRLFVHELSGMAPEIRETAFKERGHELTEMRESLKKASRKAWKDTSAFALGIMGAAWTVRTGNPIAAALSSGALLLKGAAADKPKTGAYSYIFNAKGNF